MTDHPFRYFRATGRSLEIIEQWWTDREAAMKRLRTFAEKHGCAELYGGSRIGYAQFKDALPDGWRGTPRQAKPHKGTARGKEIAKEFAELTIPDAWEFSKRIGVGMVFTDEPGARGGNVIRAASAEKIGDAWIIKVPLGCDEPPDDPPDAAPLKVSEYFALKEAAPAAAA